MHMTHNGQFPAMPRRSVQMDVPKLLHHLANLGWTNSKLAQMSGVETRTIERIMQRHTASRRVYAEILNSIQFATREKRLRLGMMESDMPDPSSLELALPEWAHENAQSSGGVATFTSTDAAFVEITIDGDFEAFSEQKKEEFLSRIQAYLQSKNRPEVIQIRRGSVIIVLKVTPAEAEQLYFGINRGELESESIVEAKIRELERDVQWARRSQEKRTFERVEAGGCPKHMKGRLERPVTSDIRLKSANILDLSRLLPESLA